MTTFNQWQTELIDKLTAHNLSPFETVSLVLAIFFWPVVIFTLVLTLIYAFRHLAALVPSLVGKAIPTKYLPQEEKSFLEISFPADTSKSSYATEQLYSLIHTLARQKTFLQKLTKHKKYYSLEIVSTKNEGVRYVLVVPSTDAAVTKRSLLSYLPGIKIREINDYTEKLTKTNNLLDIVQLKLSNHFALSLQDQKILSKHDPISYITGVMTKLKPSELISFQLVTTPVLSQIHTQQTQEMDSLRSKMYRQEPLNEFLQKTTIPLIGFPLLVFKAVAKVFGFSIMFAYSMVAAAVDTSGKSVPFLKDTTIKIQPSEILNPYEQELKTVVKDKIDQHLFETSIRFLVVSKDKEEVSKRISGFLAAFGPFASPYQSLVAKESFFKGGSMKKRLSAFQGRIVSKGLASDNPLLSASEISDIYHFPYTDITKTEGLVKSRSRELPAPLSLKKSDTNFDVVIGVNQYGGELSPIGITLEQRLKHMYIIGKTGMGKTTLLISAIFQDMVSGRGLAVFDPHGDMIQELLRIIPKNRRNDVIFFDPSDREWPIGLNLLSPGILFSNKEDEHDWITSSVLAVFKKLTDEQYWGPRMEHILRNATLTALLTPNPNLYTLQRLLTDKTYQKKIALTLKDPVLKQFWQKEFALMGNMQLSAVTSPLTQRLGHFISSKMSRHILLQQKSGISISQIMDEGKILLINLSKGDLGEDQSFFFGTILTSFIWMATYQRTKIPESKRKDFFVYVDEFQNFATPQFAEITSEGRKFHVSLIATHQNIAQVKDKDILKGVAGNANTIVCLKPSPDDEAFILPFMDPEVEKGDIVNLAPFNFFMKVTGDESEDAFSGKTVPVDVESSEKTKDEIINYTRKHYATSRDKVEQYLEKLFTEDKPKSKKSKKAQAPATTNKTKKPATNPETKTILAKKPARRK